VMRLRGIEGLRMATPHSSWESSSVGSSARHSESAHIYIYIHLRIHIYEWLRVSTR
jgi:hypothetical protein